MTKKEKVLKFLTNNPNAKGAFVANKFGISTATVYSYKKEMRDRANTLVEEVSIMQSHAVSDGSTADYYQLPKAAKELQDLISHKNMNAQIGEIFRACYRYGEVAHSKMLRDAKKIKFYAEAEIKRLENLQ